MSEVGSRAGTHGHSCKILYVAIDSSNEVDMFFCTILNVHVRKFYRISYI